VFASMRSKGPFRPGLLAVAAGIINGLSAAFIKGMAHQIARGLHHGLVSAATSLLESWQIYAFAVTLLLATLLVQSAYQSGPIRWSLPALTAANPVTSVLLGATVLSEQVHSGPLALAGATVGLSLVVAGILALSSSSLITGEPVPGAAVAIPVGPVLPSKAAPPAERNAAAAAPVEPAGADVRD
jgi:hypothetical protein